jgi:hypothetical protein
MALEDVPGQELLPGDAMTYEPQTGESAGWLAQIAEAQKVFKTYQDKCDNIDKQYADLQRLASADRSREFQLFWANVQVLAPSIYSRPPVPVVVPKFKDRRPLYRVASEMLERATNVAFDLTDINSCMMLVRDDLAVTGRGALWVRYETKGEAKSSRYGDKERICVEHVHRRDFVHEPARAWAEAGWVARRCWMTEYELKERFRPTSGDAYLNASMSVDTRDVRNEAATRELKAQVWEIWSKTENKVVWVTEGVDVTLDEDEPHLKLEGFFPCPKPAYATTQRGSLLPVPDMLFYKDQLEEINQLTARIHALSDALRVKGFYPSGGQIGDAIETALTNIDDRKIMVPIANWAAFGGTGDQIVWLPIDVIATTVAGLVELRKAVIDDVYQIMGLSDIMRGSTEKDETATAQQLKSQYGSVRIRDKQAELVRIARDVVRIAAEVMAENFEAETLLEMSQMEIPSDRDIAEQVKQIEAQAQQIQQQIQAAQSNPEMMAQAQQSPEQAQQMLQQAQSQIEQGGQQIAKLKAQPTVEQVMKFLRNQRIRPFVLDIETDSTIQPDEQAEKQSRAEFMQSLGGMLAQFGPVVQQQPQLMPFVGELIKFGMAPYRVGRELEGVLEEAVESMMAQAQQPQPNPEAQKLEAEQAMEQQRMQAEERKLAAEMQLKERELQIKGQLELAKIEAEQMGREQEQQGKMAELQAQMQRDDQKHQQEMAKGQLEIRKLGMSIVAEQQQAALSAQSAQQDAEIKREQATRQAVADAAKAQSQEA